MAERDRVIRGLQDGQGRHREQVDTLETRNRQLQADNHALKVGHVSLDRGTNMLRHPQKSTLLRNKYCGLWSDAARYARGLIRACDMCRS